jgi:hypothetical protein
MMCMCWIGFSIALNSEKILLHFLSYGLCNFVKNRAFWFFFCEKLCAFVQLLCNAQLFPCF